MSYIAREILLSALINGAISVAFFVGVFGGAVPVPLWGLGNYAFDLVPQSFAIGLMATLVPGLLCRRALLLGRLGPSAGQAPTSGSIVALALRNALLSIVVGAGLLSATLWLLGADTIGYPPAFFLKVLYGAALGALVTRLTLKRLVTAA